MIMVVVTWLSVKTICTFKRVDFTAYKISLTTPGFGKLSRMKTGKNSCQQGKVKVWLSCILECLQQLNIEAHECTALEIAQCSWKSEVHNSLHIRSISTKNGAKYVFLHEHTYKQARKRTKLLTATSREEGKGESLHVHAVRPVFSVFIVLHPCLWGTWAPADLVSEEVPGTIPVLRDGFLSWEGWHFYSESI